MSTFPKHEMALLDRPLHILSIDVGIRNLALWHGTIEAETMEQKTLNWQVVDVLEKAGLEWPVIKKHTIQECCDVVDDYLTSTGFIVPPGEQLDLILIEHQPTNMGFGGRSAVPQIRMFGVSLTMRQTLMRMYPDAYLPNFVSAKIKLKLLEDPNIGKEEKNSAKRKRIHKNATIAIVKTLATIPKDQGSKLDDLADCWLQARGWMHVRNQRRLLLIERARLKKEKTDKKKAEKAAKERASTMAKITVTRKKKTEKVRKRKAAPKKAELDSSESE